ERAQAAAPPGAWRRWLDYSDPARRSVAAACVRWLGRRKWTRAASTPDRGAVRMSPGSCSARARRIACFVRNEPRELLARALQIAHASYQRMMVERHGDTLLAGS